VLFCSASALEVHDRFKMLKFFDGPTAEKALATLPLWQSVSSSARAGNQ